MQVLLNGIYNKFTGSTGAGTLHAVLGGRLQFAEAQQGQTYPYGVYHMISNVPSATFDVEFEEYIIQFNLFDDNSSSTDINTAFTALETLYDDCTLDVIGYVNVYMKREMSNLTKESERGIWNYMAQYRVFIQKN